MLNPLKLLTMILMFGTVGATQAAYVEYAFTVKAALAHGTELLGGPSDPLVFRFIIDSNGPNLSGSPTDGTYPIGDHGVGGFGSLSVSGVTSMLQGGAFRVSNGPSQDVLEGTVNHQTNDALINGRTLFVSSAVIWDSTAQMLSGIEIPLTDAFENYVTNGAFSLTFFPKAGDPEFLTGDYVKFSAFVNSNDLSVDVQVIPEPLTLALVTTALASVGLLGRRRKVA